MTDQDEVIRNLRSCLISCKGGIKLDNLKADYRMVAGEALPYKQFGYPTVEAFVRTISDVMVTRKNGELYVEAVPSKSTAHLTKLISRQKNTRRKAPKIKRWSPPRYAARNFAPGFKTNNFNGSQYARNSYVNSPGSFTKSTPGKSSLYTDFSRPIMPLMEATVQCPFPRNNEKPKIAPVSPSASPIKRLTDKVTNITISNQNGNNCKNLENFKRKVLNDKTAATTVINVKSKTAEAKSNLSERLRILSPERNIPDTLSPLKNNYNNGNNKSIITTVQPPPIIDTPKASSDPRKELKTCANMMNLSSPEYKMYTKKDKHSSKVTIYASVKVGAHTFHTFPEDAAYEEEAEKMAARLALVNLAKESVSPEVTTVDTKVVRERIVNIVTRHHSGIFMHLLPKCYNDQYSEALPHNWERLIEEIAEINQEKGVGGLTILCRASQTLKRSDGNPPSRDVSEIASLSGEKIQLSPIGPAVPDKLTVPETTVWQVCVTHIVSAKEVWVRIGDDNDNFVDMMNDMKKHYSQAKEFPPAVGCSVGHFYAVQEDDYWHRVQCIESDSEAGLATVFFIDEGYEEQYKFNMLYSLDKKFCVLASQAIRVALEGLEIFQDYARATTEIENYLTFDRMFLVTVHNTNTDECGSYTTVTFYDTSKEESDDNVNEIVFEKILDYIITSSKVQTGRLIELYVTHIDKHARVYAQLDTPALTLLNDEIVSQAFAHNMTNSLKGLNFTKTYLAKWNSQLYRARVTDIPNEGVTVFLIDVGKTVTISKKNLLPIENFSKTLQCIPPQATQIFLQNITSSMYDDKLVARFRELVSDTDLLLAKVTKITNGVPEVEIFKRVGPNDILASINQSVILDSQLSKVNEDSNNNIKAKKRVERRNSRSLEPVGKLNPPTISDIGQYFDVHVTLAAHPGHFIVQPLSDTNELKAMMEDLQRCYVACDGPPLEIVSEGMLYAGKFNNDWYRVYVTNIISDNEVSVYFCDFGDVTIVPRSSLQPLKSEFLKLPYQAVKAKLIGIEPLNTDWSVVDCVRFKDLVLDKNFVSVVVESVFDHFSPANGTVLGLRLIDVSTEKDIYIDKLLVEENRAKFIDGFEEFMDSCS